MPKGIPFQILIRKCATSQVHRASRCILISTLSIRSLTTTTNFRSNTCYNVTLSSMGPLNALRFNPRSTPFDINNKNNNNDKSNKQIYNSIQYQCRRTMFIQTQETPNPESLKFLPGQEVLSEGSTAHFDTMESARASPLARHLLRIEGIKSLMFGSDFVTVNKHEEYRWSELKPEVFATMMDFFASGSPIFTEGMEQPTGATPINPDDDDTVVFIKELLDSRIRPFVQEDGGDISYVKFENGVLYLKMQGACGTCPSSSSTLKGGIEGMVMHYVPEVESVEQVLEEHEEVGLDQFKRLEQSLNIKQHEKEQKQIPGDMEGQMDMEQIKNIINNSGIDDSGDKKS